MGPQSAPFLALLLAALGATPAPSETPGEREDVRLVVMIAVDQLVPEQLARLDPHFEGGLRRLLDQGRAFDGAQHLHALTDTGPGHVTLGTGCHPRRHGVIANVWWSRAAGGNEYCVGDPDSALVRGSAQEPRPGEGRSPRNLRAPTLTELVRGAVPASRSVSIAVKDRAAIGLAGSGDHVLWWDRAAGGFMSSIAYGEELPEWVADWNATWVAGLPEGPFAAGWTDALATAAGDALDAPDERVGESRGSFPYALPEVSDPPTEAEVAGLGGFVFGTAAGDHMVLSLARAALAAEELGADEHLDVLTLGLSSNDIVGHSHGPRSRENCDLLLRLDRELGELFDELDARVGAGRWVAALSSDHGVLPLPEQLAAEGIEARRVSSREVTETHARARAAIAERFGDELELQGDWRGARFSWERAGELGVDPVEVREELAEILAAEGEAWILRTFTWDLLRATEDPDAVEDELLAFSARSYEPDRTPDVAVVMRPNLLFGFDAGTSHGSPHAYDRRVPLIFLGPGFAPGRSEVAAGTVDAVPTLLAALGLEVEAEFDGRALPVD